MTIHELTDIGLRARVAVTPGLPGVAVVIPTYNYAQFLGQALDSVMAQTVAPAEVIVVDDGSSDHPEQVTRDYPLVQLIRIPNQGLAEARNVGLRAAKARYVWFLDADDLLEPTAIEMGLACIKANPGVGFVYGASVRIDKSDHLQSDPVVHPLGECAHTRLFRRNYIGVPATVLYDREKLLACGGFDRELRYCEDYDLYLRMTRDYRVAHFPELVARYRLHGGNMSNDVAKMLEWHLFVLRKNRPQDGQPPHEHERWAEGVQRATPDHALRAWMERSPPRATRWRNRLYMVRKTPIGSLTAIGRALLWRILPQFAKARIKAYVARRRDELMSPTGATD